MQAQIERGHSWMFLEDMGVVGGVPTPGGAYVRSASGHMDSRPAGVSADIINAVFKVFLPEPGLGSSTPAAGQGTKCRQGLSECDKETFDDQHLVLTITARRKSLTPS